VSLVPGRGIGHTTARPDVVAMGSPAHVGGVWLSRSVWTRGIDPVSQAAHGGREQSSSLYVTMPRQ
jgi:hypothetical protein